MTGVVSTASDLTSSKPSFASIISRPWPPFAAAPAPVRTYLSSGLNTAFVLGYRVFSPECTARGFLNARRSHTASYHRLMCQCEITRTYASPCRRPRASALSARQWRRQETPSRSPLHAHSRLSCWASQSSSSSATCVEPHQEMLKDIDKHVNKRDIFETIAAHLPR